MSFDRVTQRLRDIIDNIDAAVDYVGTMSFDAFAADRKTVDATERCLQRITEAVIALGSEQMAAIMPDLPTEEVRGLGNMLRHEYHNIDLRTIFGTLHYSLPPLRSACLAALNERSPPAL